jgi:hypothetical protein
MSVSRRRLLQHSMVAAVACVAGPLYAWTGKKNNPTSNSSPNQAENAALQPLDRAAFTHAVGSGFRVTPTTGKSSPVWLRLLAVTDLPALVPVNTASMDVPPKHISAPVQTKGFMLSFLGTLPKPLPQGTYIFEHAGMGKFSLLIVPDGPGQETYTAVINRL